MEYGYSHLLFIRSFNHKEQHRQDSGLKSNQDFHPQHFA
jgi:hypothetical protein